MARIQPHRGAYRGDTSLSRVREIAEGVDRIDITASRDGKRPRREAYDLIRLLADLGGGQAILAFHYNRKKRRRGDIYFITRLPRGEGNTARRIIGLDRPAFPRGGFNGKDYYWMDTRAVLAYARELLAGRPGQTRRWAVERAIANASMASLIIWKLIPEDILELLDEHFDEDSEGDEASGFLADDFRNRVDDLLGECDDDGEEVRGPVVPTIQDNGQPDEQEFINLLIELLLAMMAAKVPHTSEDIAD